MKHNLIIVNSIFNLIVAIQIRTKIFPYENFDIILSDLSEQLWNIYQSEEIKKVFDNVYFAKLKTFKKDNNMINKVISFFFPRSVLNRITEEKKMWDYSDVFFWNNDIFFLSLVRKNNFLNKKCKYHLYGDALGGYLVDCPDSEPMYKSKFVNILNRYFFQFESIKNIDYDYYLFSPQYLQVKTNRNIVTIPPIDKCDVKCKELLNIIFQYDAPYIKQKYIFLDGGKDGFVDEKELKKIIKEIVSVVGKENIIIRLHPRTPLNYYEDMDIDIMEAKYPWELYCINNPPNDKVLITHSTSAGLLPIILFDIDQTLYLIIDIIKNTHPFINTIKKLYAAVAEEKPGLVFFDSMEALKEQLMDDFSK